MPPHADVLQWEHLPFPKSLRDFQKLFKDDAACARYLEGAKWPKGFICPHCEGTGAAVIETEPVTQDDWECENCIGMIEHGCYCKAVGAVGPGGPLRRTEEPLSQEREVGK